MNLGDFITTAIAAGMTREDAQQAAAGVILQREWGAKRLQAAWRERKLGPLAAHIKGLAEP